MKNSISRLSTCLVVFGSLVTVSSCRDYEVIDEETTKAIAYEHEFKRAFGEIDPNQDWDLFGQLASGVGPITRANAAEAEITITNHDGDADYAINITETQHSNYTTVLPESNVANNQYENTNLGKVTQDFVSTSRHFSLAPVHWHTSATDAIGIYWYVDDESAADEAKMGRDGKLYYIKKATIFEAAKCNLYYESTNPDTQVTSIQAVSAEDVASVWTYGVPATKLITYPKEVSVPNSITSYGFWIKNGSQATKYSERNLNEIVTVNGFDEAHGRTSSYVATFNIKDQIDESSTDNNNYLCFEDWYTTGDWDLNDIVYWAKGLDETTIVDNESTTEKAILVCEDLKKFDWDFNDVALGLIYKDKTQHFYKQEDGVYVIDEDKTIHTRKLSIVAMAAGGAYESNIYINNNETAWGEIHTLLNESALYPNDMGGVTSTNHHIINADPIYGVDGQTMDIDFLSDDYINYEWNVGTGTGQFATHLSQLFKEGFIRIECTEADAVAIGTGEITYTEGTAPQMMLLPWYFEWPQERKYIQDAYDGFEDWVQDYTKTSWIYDSQDDNLVTDRGNFKAEDESASGSSSGSETSQTSETFTLDVTTPASFNYESTTYSNVVYIDLTGYKDLATTDATGELTIVYTYKPTGKIYLDDANGVELITDEFGTNAEVTTTYTLSNSRLLRALQSGGIYIVEKDNSQISVSSATLKIFGVTENRHDLTVTTPMTFSETATQQIAASSLTGATMTYESFDESIVTVDANGVVTPVKNGTTKILVTAVASGDYTANIAYVTVTVDITHDLTLSTTSLTIEDVSAGSSTFTATSSTGTVSVASSDESVATVSIADGTVTVTPKATGTATITVTASDADNNFTATSQTVEVSVYTYSEVSLTTSEQSTGTVTYEWTDSYWVTSSTTAEESSRIDTWTNGATLEIALGGSGNPAIDIRDANGNSIKALSWIGNNTSVTYSNDILSLTLTKAELDSFKNGDIHTFQIVYSNWATVSSVKLTKIE